jgi:two-component system, chemotaxis family, CheB/CheR fusion protein
MPDKPVDQDQIAPTEAGLPSPASGASGVKKDFLVVALGASAGGLDACRRLLGSLPVSAGMAFILVQHLDPTHESMLVNLLASHTRMAVRQATDGMPIERDHLYVIPPGTYLSVVHGLLHVSPPLARHGARLPFDFLLHTLAADRGAWAVGVVLSGTGSDGSLGLKAIKEQHGLVIAQDPDEAGYDGMPRSAILTGVVDLVLPVENMAAALRDYSKRVSDTGRLPPDEAQDWLPEIIDLLRIKTAHDFSHYKPGTLVRRIERRIGLAALAPGDIDRYRAILLDDSTELELLAKDLLINVTSFFRDPLVFGLLAEKIVPDMVREHSPERPIRLWIPGCSTGEETYSLAILFREAIAGLKLAIKLQVFASDVDPDAIAIAREGLYPESIAADVSPERLERFFAKDDRGYRILPELRAAVVFTVQDVLADPPFSRLDMVSCRNLLIYLQPEAQVRVLSLFHFALRDGGILLLGTSETVGNSEDRFEVVSKSERIYRHVGQGRTGEFGFLRHAGGGIRVPGRPEQGLPRSRQAVLAELCQRLVVETYAPAAVLINGMHECLFSMGPTDQYLRVAPGLPTHDLLAMARQGMRTKLRSAIQQASQRKTRVIVAGGRTSHGGDQRTFSISVEPVQSDGEELLLVCFVDDPMVQQKLGRLAKPREETRVAELERELEATRTELQGAIYNLEISSEGQRAINEEALSVQEEYQSTNEELLTSKEELQSLNEELTALNGQLQETLERQRTTSNDLQNVLYSTEVATLFLDTNLNIRFFTPASKALFNIIPSDLGRPLSDLNSLAADGDLANVARTVLRTATPQEREIAARGDAWYNRRILPYRTQDNGVEGVVVTFTDVTERRHSADALETARRQAELANEAKSRFLAAASHDLRQPLQTLALLHGLLAKAVQGERAQRLVGRLDATLSAMTGMLNTLLDINQIDTGTIQPDVRSFPVNDLLDCLRDEFNYHAQAAGITLRVIPCGLSIHSDPRLLEQVLRNLLSNALKYTRHGKVLLGCRRHGGTLSIEVWDTGIGIPEKDLQVIFDEYHQLDNPARERGRGLGLGLAIVRRLGQLLGHRIDVRSHVGKGSVFTVEVRLQPDGTETPNNGRPSGADEAEVAPTRRSGSVLVLEDDPDIRDLLHAFLIGEGHRVMAVADGVAALDVVTTGKVIPDLILADYNLPKGMDGAQTTERLRKALNRPVPVIMLTGDISTNALRDMGLRDCVPLTKPVKLKELTRAIRQLLPTVEPVASSHPARAVSHSEPPIIYIVDDDDRVRASIRGILEEQGRIVEDYPTGEAFLAAYHPGRNGCLVVDAYLPGMDGLELLRRVHDAGHRLPAIMITGNSDVTVAVQAMQAGAVDFIEKPFGPDKLQASIDRAIEQSQNAGKLTAWRESAADQLTELTPRQRQILERVLAGKPSKNIAVELGISQRTVENHRAAIMKKTGTRSLPELARLALAADWNHDEPRN